MAKSVVLLSLAFLLSGCAGMVAHMIIDAPNASSEFASSRSGRYIKQMADPYFSTLAFVPVGPPPAKLSVAVMPPADYGLSTRAVDASADGCSYYSVGTPRVPLAGSGVKLRGDDGELIPDLYRRYREAVKALPRPEPKATVILLHGYGLNKYTMLWWGFALGEAGYRTVLVDLRGHGESTGQWTTYGVLESRDIEQVIDYLDARNLIAGPLAILGDSLGAAVAIDVAARDQRVQAVVALHPFARAEQIIENFGTLAHPFLSALIPDSSIAAGEAQAGRLAGVDLAEAAPIEAVEKVSAPILLIYGKDDRLTPPATAHAFEQAAPDGKLIMLDGYGHMSLSTSPLVMKRALQWLAPRLDGGIPNLSVDVAGADAEDSVHFPDFKMCFH